MGRFSGPVSYDSSMANSENSLARRGVGTLVTMLSGQAATMAVLAVSGFVIPRYLGAADYGRYAATMAVVGIMMTAFSFGLPQVGMRYLAPPVEVAGDPPGVGHLDSEADVCSRCRRSRHHSVWVQHRADGGRYRGVGAWSALLVPGRT